MRILAIGDIVGQRAVEKLQKELSEIKKKENLEENIWKVFIILIIHLLQLKKL